VGLACSTPSANEWGVPVFHLLVDQPKRDAPISLQDHDDVAWFRDIKIKPL
jgi:hypothetical protein